MSGLKGRERLQPSLLDRLTDNAPNEKRDPPDQQVLTLPQLRQAVLRDLAALMNTTNLSTLKDLSETPRVEKSTVNFGIPGFAGMTESSSRISALEKDLTEAIKAYEPRIRPETLSVKMRGSGANEANPSLIFEIQGELWAQPVPLKLFLETAIDVETRQASVVEVKGA